MNTFIQHTWPISQLDEALAELMQRRGLESDIEASIEPQPVMQDAASWNRYIASAGGQRGFDVEPVVTPYGEVEQTLCVAAPALVRIELEGEPRLMVLARGGRRPGALSYDRRIRRLDPAVIRRALCATLEAPEAADTDRLLEDAGLAATNRTRAALLRERLSGKRVEGIWLLRQPSSSSFLNQLRQAGLTKRFYQFVTAHVLQYTLWLLAWWAIGAAALQGRFDSGWLAAWALLLLTLVPFRLLVTWLQGYISVHSGRLLKRRLLFGALELRVETVRRQGVGQLLGRVLESNAIEGLALGGGFLAFVAVIELVMAACVLAVGAGGLLQAGVLLAWIAVVVNLGWRSYRRQSAWTDERLMLTHRLVERMVGHRTRLAQQSRDRWHTGEDREVANYLNTAHAMDRIMALLLAMAPRGWLIAGFAALTPAFVDGRHASAMAVALGGTLLAYQAFQRLTLGLAQLAGAAISWKQVKDIFHAGKTPKRSGIRSLTAGNVLQPGDTILEANDLSYRYQPDETAVLENARLEVRVRDRLLLEGLSGSGKSTLASLLTGLREPDSGLMLLRGLDRFTLGLENWRRHVVSAPQFHENHVLTGTFAFNLLMGRRWPPTKEDVEEAERVCRELGLGDLLERMPAGLMQMVGETGWQLSHGEKSRLFLARALLQKADFIILDESFGALDPENRAKVMSCVLEQAPALMVIAHP